MSLFRGRPSKQLLILDDILNIQETKLPNNICLQIITKKRQRSQLSSWFRATENKESLSCVIASINNEMQQTFRENYGITFLNIFIVHIVRRGYETCDQWALSYNNNLQWARMRMQWNYTSLLCLQPCDGEAKTIDARKLAGESWSYWSFDDVWCIG